VLVDVAMWGIDTSSAAVSFTRRKVNFRYSTTKESFQ
jgi:hypothetical protein